MPKLCFALFVVLISVSVSAQNRPSTGKERMAAFEKQKAAEAKSPYKDLVWRNVGPDIISGRVSEVLGVSGNKNIIWASFATSGFWKTEDAGKTWTSLFDKEATLSIGAFGIAPSNQEVIYLGTGEANIFRASLPGTRAGPCQSCPCPCPRSR